MATFRVQGFQTVSILKSQTLGAGSYGSVFKAQCDELVCAAKVVHPHLLRQEQELEGGDGESQENISPGDSHRLPVKRFEKECELLSAIRHPNIVQFLGVWKDPASSNNKDSNLILLLELMDESLTHFLEKYRTTTLPFHTQVNICHDVAMALSFLHSNGIIHRDLSSNNVLMIGDRRAKVSDFGMARLFDEETQSLTKVPGTRVYMPPEALDEVPRYSYKLDCFSLGVLIIQIVTTLFPKPGRDLKRAAEKGEALYQKVCEVERRSNHIGLVEKSHALLIIACDCIRDKEEERPSAMDTLRRVSELMRLHLYKKSEKTSSGSFLEVELRQRDEKILELERCLAQKDKEMEYVSAEFQERISDLRYQLERQARSGTDPVPHEDRVRCREGKRSPRALHRMSNAVINGDIIYFICLDFHLIFYAYNCSSSTWLKLPSIDPNKEWHISTMAITMGQLTTIGGYDEDENFTNRLFTFVNDETWMEVFPSMPTKRDSSIAFSYEDHLLVAGGTNEDNRCLRTVEVLDMRSMQWFTATPLPEPLSTASATICRDSVFILGGWYSQNTPTCSVLTCNVEELIRSTRDVDGGGTACVWNRIADLPVLKSTCICYHGHLITLGGVDETNKAINYIYRYDHASNSWRVIGHLSIPRGQAYVSLLPSDEILVVGGHKGYYINKIYEVEILNILL